MSEQQIGPHDSRQWQAMDNVFLTGEGCRKDSAASDQDVAIATADAIRKLARKVSDASWALDAALSAQRKAGTGYREGPGGDSGSGGGTYKHGGRPLAQCVADAQSILSARGRV